MFNISDYLKKFARIEGDSLMQKQSVSGVLKDICGTDIDFDIKKGVLYIKGSPIVKNVVYTKKAAIMSKMREVCPQLKISDIC